MLHRDSEDYTEFGTLYRTINSFRLRGVYKKFGLNLTEFLDLPREIVELIMRICIDESMVEAKDFNKVKKQLDKSFEE